MQEETDDFEGWNDRNGMKISSTKYKVMYSVSNNMNFCYMFGI